MDTQILSASADGVARAAELLRAGELVAFPTETVYGLGADATNDAAVAAIFAAKDRPRFNPLIVHCPDLAAVERLVEMDDRARELAATFWPGALTLVLRRRPDSGLSLLVSAGLDTVAVRVPDNPFAQALLRACGRPLAAPSANRSSEISATNSVHVTASLGGRIAAVLDGGQCRVGIESTVVDVSGPAAVLLRPGGVPAEVIEAVIGPLAQPDPKDAASPRSPGMLSRHYAPSIPLRLDVTEREKGEALLGFGPAAPKRALNLSRKGDLQEAAANLFAMMRALDVPGIRGIAVMPIPEVGLGRAINDRLRRAATPAADDGDDDDWHEDRGPAAPCRPLDDGEASR
ncbi:MAG: threonylcarbamoyl-AMP synthase [Hyphomicrobiales bacterium]|nr:threonylcarbamoyl-AMP synthase [Hyphomicrobiales bacterium]MCP5372535.1 threonylcarbamoyl-AMP synthase [Hyphomicrobiales bacterium]